ncbi:RNase H domain-containing protein [Trichonephila clavipes]|nr:RNase H domain-containing protein [Trichonephila clavipes]
MVADLPPSSADLLLYKGYPSVPETVLDINALGYLLEHFPSIIHGEFGLNVPQGPCIIFFTTTSCKSLSMLTSGILAHIGCFLEITAKNVPFLPEVNTPFVPSRPPRKMIRPVAPAPGLKHFELDEALRIIKTVTSSNEIWILCGSRSAIQHLSDWTNVGDKTSILKNLKELSQQHEIYFQWIPSHIGLFGNDTADLLAKEGVTEDLMSRRTLTFSEIFSKTKSLIQELWKTPPTHPWYNRQAPGGALSIKADRVVQTTISRLASRHTTGLSFHLGQKIYEDCTKCNLVQATPDHLLLCAGLDREDIYSSPLLVQMNSLAASVKLTYSASMVDRLTDFCLKVRHEIGVSSIKVMNPPIDTRSSLFVAKSE